MNTRALPRFQDEGAALTRSGTASDATFGWVLIWVVVGLGVLLVGAIIWFVSFPSSDESDERAVPAPATRIYENRGSR
jgi:hypothetical protein